jgi:hypothetical protein
MDVSDLRKRILRAIDDARKDASARRTVVDEAAKAFDTFLTGMAVPLMRQAVNVLRAEGQSFNIQTPAGSARIVADRTPDSFLEIALDPAADPPQAIGRVSVARGRQNSVVDERPIADGKAIAELTEEDVSAYLVAELVKLVVR